MPVMSAVYQTDDIDEQHIFYIQFQLVLTSDLMDNCKQRLKLQFRRITFS